MPDHLELVYIPGCHWKESVIPVAPFLSGTVSHEATWLSVHVPRVCFRLLGYPHLLVIIIVLTADCFGQKFVFGETLLLVLVFLPLLVQTSERSGPLFLVGRHQDLKARKSLEVESCRLFSSLVKYCCFPCKYLKKSIFLFKRDAVLQMSRVFC